MVAISGKQTGGDSAQPITNGGTKAGAIAWFATIAPGGKVPASWLTSGPPPSVASKNGKYTFVGSKGYGNIYWIKSDGITNGDLYVAWDAKGNVTNINVPDTGQVKQDPLLGIPDAIGSAASSITDLSGLIQAITSKALWERIGYGAAGVAIIGVALIIWLKKG